MDYTKAVIDLIDTFAFLIIHRTLLHVGLTIGEEALKIGSVINPGEAAMVHPIILEGANEGITVGVVNVDAVAINTTILEYAHQLLSIGSKYCGTFTVGQTVLDSSRIFALAQRNCQ